MPKQVDHKERRDEMLEAVWRVVARDGLEAVTIRGIARETDWSTGGLGHYFRDKDDILGSALRLAYERATQRRERKLGGLRGLPALFVLTLDNLPLDDERELETKFLLNYWSRAIRGQEIVTARRQEPFLIQQLTSYIQEVQDDGVISTEHTAEDCAEVLLGLIDGFSLHALLDPVRLTRERQVELVEGVIDRMTVTGPGTTRRVMREAGERGNA